MATNGTKVTKDMDLQHAQKKRFVFFVSSWL